MMERPETRGAEVDGVRIAYQAFGEGSRTLLGVPGFAQDLDAIWEQPAARRFFERLGQTCRVIHFDKRGTGQSDRDLPPPGLEERVRDIAAVMEVEQIERAVLGGFSEGAALAVFFAATYPRRVDGLVLSGSFASYVRQDDHPWARSRRRQERATRLAAASWGQGVVSAVGFAPSMALRPSFWRWARAYERSSLSRTDFVPYNSLNLDLDIRHILGAVQAPTLVLHAKGDRLVPVESGRYIADRITGARFVELPTRDHAPWFAAQDTYLEAIEGFLTWKADVTPDRGRTLATVLFTDIEASTQEAGRLGDAQWVDLLERHDAISREEVTRSSGRWVKSTGDGMLATFDRPVGAITCADRLRGRVFSELGLRMRAGLHTAEVELRAGDIGGLGVHQAARVQAKAAPMEIVVTAAVRALTLGSAIGFRAHGIHELKGIEAPCELFLVEQVP